MAPKKATAQATLDGFTGSSPKRGAKRQADGQFIAPDTKKPKVETGGESASSSSKRVQGMKNAQGDLGEKATAAELADGMETPYAELLRTIEEGSKNKIEPKGDVVVHWCRMKDLRLQDNRGLSFASVKAQEESKHLVVLFVLSSNEFKAHKRGARRIDFVLRNLRVMQQELDQLNIPLHVISQTERKTISNTVVDWLKKIGASHIFGNIEHEVDEARQLTMTYGLCRKASIQANWVHDSTIVPPGEICTKQGKPYSVYSPWYKNWSAKVLSDPATYLDEAPMPKANDESARKHSTIGELFKSEIPESVPGYELSAEDGKNMTQLWPAGYKAAEESLNKFAKAKEESVKAEKDPKKGEKEKQQMADDGKKVLINGYADGRSRVDQPNTSRISPYLSAGVISVRQAVRATLLLSNNKLKTEKGSGIGTWVSEVAWRDFYSTITALFPRVVMGKAFQTKMDDVVWEYNDEHLKAWKEGRTGYPMVDAGMRQMASEGWMHNRARMNVASFLCKHLMLDWREGERYFHEMLVDADFGANNGGWQWCASTGSDPQPYFRVFNPTSQSEKFDPDGAYIKRYVPELAKLSGKAVHEPSKHKSKAELAKLGYPAPIVEHAKARKRALARYKNPGDEADE